MMIVNRLQFIIATTGMGGATCDHLVSVHMSVACDYDGFSSTAKNFIVMLLLINYT